MKNSYSLVDEPWIPVANIGKISLMQIFKNSQYRSLGGNPIQKIALFKLLLAISQAACTPNDKQEWWELGAEGLASRCIDYLEKWHACFFLYGEKPFLQMTEIKTAKVQFYGAVLPEISTNNTTVHGHYQIERSFDDADKALLLVSLMGFAFAGKQVDNNVILTPGYKGKTKSGKAGPSMAGKGLLHSFLLGKNLQESLWLNLLTTEQINKNKAFTQGVGTAPWEKMPEGENCPVAQGLKQSVMGRLVPMCRFCLLQHDGLRYSEGIAHLGYKEGMVDPSVAVKYSAKDPKVLWVNPERRPWRELTSLLGLFENENNQGFKCWQIDLCLGRVRDAVDIFALWSGGAKISITAGEQKMSGKDDFVESVVWLDSSELGETWFAQLKIEMVALDTMAKSLYGCVTHFYKEQQVDGTKLSAQATHLFWQFCERNFQDLVKNCESKSYRHKLRKLFSAYMHQSYDKFCPKETARQLDAWAKCQPNNSKYLSEEV